jgi:hypothetical protein
MATVFDSDTVHKFLSNGRKREGLIYSDATSFASFVREFGEFLQPKKGVRRGRAESLTQKKLK